MLCFFLSIFQAFPISGALFFFGMVLQFYSKQVVYIIGSITMHDTLHPCSVVSCQACITVGYQVTSHFFVGGESDSM